MVRLPDVNRKLLPLAVLAASPSIVPSACLIPAFPLKTPVKARKPLSDRLLKLLLAFTDEEKCNADKEEGEKTPQNRAV